MRRAEGARFSKRILQGMAAGVCAAAFLWLTIPSQAQQSLQTLHNHVRPQVASGEIKPLGLLSASKHLHLAIQLPLRNQSDLTAFLGRLYDRNSPDFHKYLSVEEFTEKYAPAKEDYQTVVDFVKANGMKVIDTPKNRMLVEVDGAVPQVESAFHVTMREYQHPTEKRTFYSADSEPSLALKTPIAHISGLDNYDSLHSAKARTMAAGANVGSAPNGTFLPTDVRMAYYGNGPLDGTGQCVGLVTFWGFNTSDVSLTFTSANLPDRTLTTPINTVLLGGLTAPMISQDDAEPITDIIAAMSIAPNLSQVREYQCCGTDFEGSGATAAQDVIFNSIATENACKQISQSAGVIPQQAIDDPYFEEMAAQGQTFFTASGDGGSPPEAGSDTADYFYPGDNAWITVVGATSLNTNGPGGSWASEVADTWSGGGVSNGVNPTPIPSYQVPVINATNGGSLVYRNLPDVSIMGDTAYACINGQCNQTGGTSYSSPLWASFMALVNQQAAENNQPPVGFLNPIIYQIGQNSTQYARDFHDMIGGNNDCCGQTVYYNVVAGYDLVSGWGTPNGQNLINDLLSDASTPGFTLMTVSDSLSIGRSDNGAVNILVGETGGFTGNVTLSASGLPSGVTASFSPNPATVGATTNPPTSQASVLTLTADATATVGTSTVTITGTSGSVSATTNIALTVTATPGNFTVGYGPLSPAAAFTFPGSSVTTSITVNGVDSFNSAVTLSAPNLPTGIMASFSPSSVTPVSNSSCPTANPCATANLTLNLYSTAPAGLQAITIAGTSGSLVNSVSMPMQINSAGSGPLPNGVYTVKNSLSGLLWDDPGSSTTWNQPLVLNSSDAGSDEQWVFISVGGTLGNAYYQIANMASGLYFTVQGDSTTAGSPLAQWGSNGGTPDQEWLLTASGNGYTITSDFDQMVVDPSSNIIGAGLVQQTANSSGAQVWLISNNVPLPDFSIGITNNFESLSPGGSVTGTVTITSLNGFNSATTLSVSGLPSGVTASFSANPVTPAAYGNVVSTLTLTSSSTSAMNRTSGTPGRPLLPAVLLTLLLVPFGKRFLRARRSFLARTMMLAVGLLFLILGPVACGGNTVTKAAPAGPGTPYKITLTATSGPLTHSTSVTVYVQ